jgi:hypothetical protein
MNKMTSAVALYVAALFVAAMFVAACTPATGGTTPVPGDLPAGGQAALTRLCGEGNLNSLATQLDAVDENTDTSAISTAIGTTMADLQSLQLEAGQMAIRDAAVTALTQLDAALSDPATRAQVATQAAAALRSAQGELCN